MTLTLPPTTRSIPITMHIDAADDHDEPGERRVPHEPRSARDRAFGLPVIEEPRTDFQVFADAVAALRDELAAALSIPPLVERVAGFLDLLATRRARRIAYQVSAYQRGITSAAAGIPLRFVADYEWRERHLVEPYARISTRKALA
ncbi:hypothetical protein [Microbacterium sp. B24]|uniref:hypothetical protein n=1 Tax=Microbacterium sp. B24 TaxID=95616 RepID=UPI00042851FD|nr:hypothetical protein [Microbacterium sp. B24]